MTAGPACVSAVRRVPNSHFQLAISRLVGYQGIRTSLSLSLLVAVSFGFLYLIFGRRTLLLTDVVDTHAFSTISAAPQDGRTGRPGAAADTRTPFDV